MRFFLGKNLIGQRIPRKFFALATLNDLMIKSQELKSLAKIKAPYVVYSMENVSLDRRV